MYPSKRIALIIPDVLRSIGLKCLIEEFFPDHEAISFQDFRSFMGYAGREGFDYYITDPEIHVRNDQPEYGFVSSKEHYGQIGDQDHLGSDLLCHYERDCLG